MKKIFILSLLLVFGLGVSADELYSSEKVNMTPQSAFSGYTDNSSRNIYPKLNYSYSASERKRQELLKPKSIHDMDTSSVKPEAVQMKFEDTPQNVDSSNMLYTPGLRNLQNVNMYF